jgi:hypothetical protein
MFEVYHAVFRDPTSLSLTAMSLSTPAQALEAFQTMGNAGDSVRYHKVADVKTDDVDDVFRLTNSIDCSWWLNREVTPCFNARGCRSTSCGDVVVSSDGQPWLVVSPGFQKVDAELFARVKSIPRPTAGDKA